MDKELKTILQTLATKKDLESFVTKSDLERFGVKFASKEEIDKISKAIVTKRDLREVEIRFKGYADKKIEKLARIIAESSAAERGYVDAKFAHLEKRPIY